MSNAGLKKLVVGLSGRELSVCFGMAVTYWERMSGSGGRAGIVSGPFDRLTYIRRCIACGVQRAVVRSSIWLIMRSIRECIGAVVATVGKRGHFKSVDATVVRVKVAIATGGMLDCSPADCGVFCIVIGSSGSVARKRVEGGRDASGCCVGGAVVVLSVDGGKRRFHSSMFSRICCLMAARSTGSYLGRSAAVGESVGAKGWDSG